MNESHSMHGLRKSLGVKLALADATTRQLMEALGQLPSHTQSYILVRRRRSGLQFSVRQPDGNGGSRRKKSAFRLVK